MTLLTAGVEALAEKHTAYRKYLATVVPPFSLLQVPLILSSCLLQRKITKSKMGEER